MRRRFEGKVALVTAAGNGIARECCVQLAKEGARIAAIDTDKVALGDLAQKLGGNNEGVYTLVSDALDEASVAQAVKAIVSRFGTLDILVNAVGGSTIHGQTSQLLETMSYGDFLDLLRFNLAGTFLFCREIIPIMKDKRDGRIVNVSSIAARGTARSNAAYSAAKAGISSLTTKLANELAPYGIRCNAIAPGLTMTERMKSALSSAAPEELERRLLDVPLGRFATAAEQASVICFLASDEASFITGSTIFVTGGA
jgi:NAD(P)-dependent dehydrogenase (short-subunit alcohol dehydrogenase family)